MEMLKHKLSPEQLDNLYFDHERRLRIEHFYQEIARDADLERDKERMSHEVECSLIKEKFMLKIRQKYADKELTDDDIKLLTDQIMAGDDES